MENENKRQQKHILYARRIILVVFFAAVTFIAANTFLFIDKNNGSGAVGRTIEYSAQDPFRDLAIKGKSVFVYDVVKDRILYEKNAELQLPLASVTKVMTALIARELASDGQLISITPQTLAPEGDSGFLVGEKWRLKDLIDLTLISSSNDGARALASAAYIKTNKTSDDFIDRMNEKAKELDLPQTFFLNESGLDVSNMVAGAYGSARDMSTLFLYVLENSPDLLEATTYSAVDVYSTDAMHRAANTNRAIEQIPGIIASKTGFTDLAGGNLVIAFEAGPMRPIIIAVLGSGVEERFTDVNKLVRASLAAIKTNWSFGG